MLTTSPGYDGSGEWRLDLALSVSALKVERAKAAALVNVVVAVFGAEIVITELKSDRKRFRVCKQRKGI